MKMEPSAYLTPRIIESLKRAPEWEGEVAWHPTLIGDSAPVTDKHGVTHAPKPLYSAPAPELAEALQRMVDSCQDCDGEGTQFYVDGRTASGGVFENHRPCPNCSEGRQLLARITPK